MSNFDNLHRKDGLFYRGSYRQEAEAITSLAVGPIRAVAKHISDNGLDVCDAVRNNIEKFFNRAIILPNGPLLVQGAPQGEVSVCIPGNSLADRLSILLKRPPSSQNMYTIFEHVLYEPNAQINSSRTSKLLESISFDPKVAILYAYGIDPDIWFDSKQVKLWSGRPNPEAFIAVLPKNVKTVEAKKILDMLCNIACPGTMTKSEAKRRMMRDSEELLSEAVRPDLIVKLPAFVSKDSIASLNNAADTLCKRGVAL